MRICLFPMTYLWCNICDRVLVMHEGRLVDEFVKEEIFAPDRHPYTRQLVAEYD